MILASAGRCCRRIVHNHLHLAPFSSQLGGFSRYTSTSSTSMHQVCEPADPSSSSANSSYEQETDWDNLGFDLVTTDYMYVMKSGSNGSFDKGELCPFGNIQLNPASGVLNYGQGLFEGTKAYRKDDGGLLLFRPELNAMRMQKGAERMCMPCPSTDQFIESVKQIALANNRWVPPAGKGTLYIRPMLLGTGPGLGVAPSPDYTFLVYASPVGNYFKNERSLNLYVEEEYDRSSRLGTGGVKAIGNYAPVLKAMSRAKSRGFSDVLFLDSVEKKNVEEASACNIFMVKGNVISTPAAEGTILPGITRKSIIEIANDHGYQVEEGVVPVDKLLEADEVFCTGTAVVVAPVTSITYRDQRVEYKTGTGTVTWELYSTLVGIQRGVVEDKKGWTVKIN
ncbi:Branched-chain-amino-acid aminotransferase 2, chloroplastic [Linum perenne]